MSSDKQIHSNFENVEIRNSKTGSIFWMTMSFLCALAFSKLYWGAEDRKIEYLVLFIFFVLGVIFFFWQYRDRSVRILITKEGIWSYKEFFSWENIDAVKAERKKMGDNLGKENLVIVFKKNGKRKKIKKIDLLTADKTVEQVDEIVKRYFEYYKSRQSSGNDSSE